MANLGYGLETTRHGNLPTETLRSKPLNAHTRTNLLAIEPEVCPTCRLHILEGECMCTLVEPPYVAPQAPSQPATVVPRKVSSTHWIVDSFTTTLVAYHLRLNEYGVWMCSCPDFNRRNKLECKHSRLLCAYLDKLADRDAQKPATPIVEAKAGGCTKCDGSGFVFRSHYGNGKLTKIQCSRCNPLPYTLEEIFGYE